MTPDRANADDHISFERYLNTIIRQSFPLGHIRIIETLVTLLREKEFRDITIAEIARVAGVAETLIYKYYRNKQDMLYQTIRTYAEYYLSEIEARIASVEGVFNRIRQVISIYINTYNVDMTFTRIVLIELRNTLGYYDSDLYRVLRSADNTFSNLVQEGMRNGVIRNDISPDFMGQFILGSIEQVCRSAIIKREYLPVVTVTDQISKLVLDGIARR